LNDQLQFVSQLVDKFDSKIVVTLGSQGLIYASRHFDPIVLPPVPAKQAIDETGCGDAFRAGMLHQFSRGARIDEALLFASAVGSLNVETLGAARRKITEHEIHDRIAAFPEIKTLYCELLQGAN
jgi:adenosine kinase